MVVNAADGKHDHFFLSGLSIHVGAENHDGDVIENPWAGRTPAPRKVDTATDIARDVYYAVWGMEIAASDASFPNNFGFIYGEAEKQNQYRLEKLFAGAKITNTENKDGKAIFEIEMKCQAPEYLAGQILTKLEDFIDKLGAGSVTLVKLGFLAGLRAKNKPNSKFIIEAPQNSPLANALNRIIEIGIESSINKDDPNDRGDAEAFLRMRRETLQR